MKNLWLCFVFIYTVSGLDFGRSYLKDSKLCRQWSCINNKFGFSDTLPSRDQYTKVLRSLLPDGDWQDVVEKTLDVCYGDRPRRYINTCPGQAMLHCVVDQLIQNCPDGSLRKNDACAPVSTLAGFNYMFSQSRYENLEENLPKERRPSWFLKNYFSSKCCNLPELFNTSVMQQCGFTSVVLYYKHTPHADNRQSTTTVNPEANSDVDAIKIVDIVPFESPATSRSTINKIDYHDVDPLDCCDMSDFIQPSWRSECDFSLSWSSQQRLVVKNFTRASTTTPAPTTTTATPPASFNVKIVPLSCAQENCVFRKLNVVSESGAVNLPEFSKLLDNMTNLYPLWTKAKARVITKCLNRPTPRLVTRGYTEDCEINKLLTCTFDILSENCPHAKKDDPCRSNKESKNATCQISASKYRPKNRRQFCGIPSLVNHQVLSECGTNSISRMEYVLDPPTPRITPSKYSSLWRSPMLSCQGSSNSTKSLLKKMGVLNKYDFLDYFKMKDKIRNFTSDSAWSSFTEMYLATLSTTPMYKKYCSTSKKLLNLLDVMLTTCPMSKRKNSLKCSELLTEMANTAPTSPPEQKLNEMKRHYQHVYIPSIFLPTPVTESTNPTAFGPMTPITLKPIQHDLSPEATKVKTMPIGQQPLSKKPLVLLPVYLRTYGQGKGSLSVISYKDNVLRSMPFALHDKIAAAHKQSP